MDPIRIYDYLIRSRSYVLRWTGELSDEGYRTEHPIGLGSPARTLHHMMAAEWLYMQRIRGRTAPLGDLPHEHDPEVSTASSLGFADLHARWMSQQRETREDISRSWAGGDDGWNTPLLVSTVFDGNLHEYRASPADIFVQLIMHEIHHRAQVLHMLKRSGISTGEIDFNTLMYMPRVAD